MSRPEDGTTTGNTAYRQDFGTGLHLRLGGAEAPTGYVNPLDADELRFSDIGDLRLGSGFDDAPSGIGNLAMYPTESYVDSRSSELVRDPLYDHLEARHRSGFHRSFDGGASFELLHDFGSGTVLEIEQGGATATCSTPSPSGGWKLHASPFAGRGRTVNRHGPAHGMEQHGDCSESRERRRSLGHPGR